MKTVGQILKSTRENRNISIEEVEKAIKIKKNFIKAMESGNYDSLPPSTFTRGFIKNYSEFLGLSANEILAFYRREFDERKDKRLIPKGLADENEDTIVKITPKRISVFLIALLFIGLIIYLMVQYTKLSGGPYLMVYNPNDNSVVISQELEVSGKIDPEAQLKINGQQVLTAEGKFKEYIYLNEGLNTLTLEATGRNGKSSIIQRHVRLEVK